MIVYGTCTYAEAQANALAIEAAALTSGGCHLTGTVYVARPDGRHAARPCVSLPDGGRVWGDGADVSRVVSHPGCTGQTRLLGVGLVDTDPAAVAVRIDDIGLRNDVVVAPVPTDKSHALFFYGLTSAGITARIRNVVVEHVADGDGLYCGMQAVTDTQNLRVLYASRRAADWTGASKAGVVVRGCWFDSKVGVGVEMASDAINTGMVMETTYIGGPLVFSRSVGLQLRGLTVHGLIRLTDATDALVEDLSAEYRRTDNGEGKGLELKHTPVNVLLRRVALRTFGAPGLYIPAAAAGTVRLEAVTSVVDPGTYVGSPGAPAGAALWAPGGPSSWVDGGDNYWHVR